MSAYISVKRIGPKEAEAMLEHNTHNRRMNRGIVARYAKIMRAGDWQMNGEAIQVAEDGTLLNGQHRLSAVIASGIPVEFLVVEGLPMSTFITLDQGKKRGAGDVLKMKGHTYADSVAGAGKMLVSYRLMKTPFANQLLTTPEDIVREVEATPRIHEFAERVGSRLGFVLRYIKPSPAIFMMVVFHENDDTAAALFFDSLDSGANLEPNSPIRALRERLVLQTKITQLDRRYLLAMVFKAFRMYRDDQPCKMLKVNFDNEEDRYKL